MIDLNDVATPKARHDLAAVKDRLAATAGDWLPGIFPEARLARDRRSLRCADLSGRPPRKEGSCTIHLDGPYAGWGFDYATGESAGPIDLIAQATGLSDGALFDEAARIAGMDRPAPRSAPRPKLDHSTEVARLVDGAQPLAGTVGEAYLRARGLGDPGCPDLLFHPDLPDFDTRRGWPGLIALPRVVTGERAPGIHRTFLLDDGSAKGPAGKKMLGSVADAAVRLFAMPAGGHLGIAEGIETALAAHALFGTAVWVALSADGLARFRWPEGTTRVTIYADAGDAGRQAAATLSDRLNRADIPNEIVVPLHGDDFNDDLLRGARADDYGLSQELLTKDLPAETERLPSAGDIIADLVAAADALTNPPDISALGELLGRIALARLDPLPARQILARIKTTTGIAMSILDKQLVELVKRVNVSGDPHARIAKPAWFNRLRQDLVGTPERNEANVIIALTSDVAFAGVLAFDDFSQEIVVRQPLPWDAATGPFPRPWEDADELGAELLEDDEEEDEAQAAQTEGQAIESRLEAMIARHFTSVGEGSEPSKEAVRFSSLIHLAFPGTDIASVKDRAALAIIEDAERRGKLRPGGVMRGVLLTEGLLSEATDVRSSTWSLDGGVLVLGNLEPSTSWRVDVQRLEVAPPSGPTFRRVRCLGAD